MGNIMVVFAANEASSKILLAILSHYDNQSKIFLKRRSPEEWSQR